MSEFPSGDGTAGGKFNFIVALLSGDANSDGRINYGDYWAWYVGQSGTASYADGDFDGDGDVDNDDYDLMIANINETQFSFTSLFLLGDLNGTWSLDYYDENIIWNNIDTPGTWEDGDLDGDDFVDQADLAIAQMFTSLGLFYGSIVT